MEVIASREDDRGAFAIVIFTLYERGTRIGLILRRRLDFRKIATARPLT
jgi:hypothetical protein